MIDKNDPFSTGAGSSIVRVVSVSELVLGYRKQLGIDVESYFQNLDQITIRQCNVTGLQFYSPLTVVGDGRFYANLQKFPWYYLDEKWEYEWALKRIEQGANVLEIGCGNGAFLDKLKTKGINATGLEINADAANNAKGRGHNVFCTDLEEFSVRHSGEFTAVCMFQVLEHIPNPLAFLKAACRCLGRGGEIFISVPNNEGFMRYNDKGVLNYPPHHQLRWAPQSLVKIAPFLGLKHNFLECEPLQPIHVGNMVHAIRATATRHHGFLAKCLLRICHQYLVSAVKEIAPVIKGHTIISHYKKV